MSRLQGDLLYLSRADVAGLGIAMADVIDVVEQAFREKAAGRVELPAKLGIHPGGGDSFVDAMPASIPGLGVSGVKWVSAYPQNPPRGLPYVSALLILTDPDSGVPLAVMDAGWITAARTGAATGVAARSLARPDAGTAGVLGCGVQGRTNLEALTVVLPIRLVRAYDPDGAAARAYADDVARRLGLAVEVVPSARDAVVGSDVIVTAGPIARTPHATIRAGWMAAGAFASLVDYDSYWHADAFAEIDVFCVDDIPQVERHRSLGRFRGIPTVDAELAEIVAGLRPGRRDGRQRTMTMNLGIAMADIATASLVYRRATEAGAGTRLPL
jgi:ornithine cyclodeaminase/alanine dehydrogenase-like protein (mu-crystallin family)